MPDGNPLSALITLLSGAGFEKFASGVHKLGQSGFDLTALLSLPNLPLLLAGAGAKDAANSMQTVAPILKMLMPQQQQQQGPNPNELSSAMRMLSARLGPGMAGIIPPPPQITATGPTAPVGVGGPQAALGGMI